MRHSPRVRAAAALTFTLLSIGSTTASLAQEPESAVLDATRSTLAQWVETEQILSREKRDWQEGQEILEQRIALLESELASLDDKLQQSRDGLNDAERRRRQLFVEQRDLDAASAVLVQKIGAMEQRLAAMVPALPDPLRQKLQPLAQRLPQDSLRTELTLGTRFQNVVGILNEVNKFNGDITVANEVLSLPGGVRVEVQSVYVGLGQAYYVTLNGDAAGIGVPSEQGWEWTAANDLAPQISEVIAILQNDKVPAYVPLPVSIR